MTQVDDKTLTVNPLLPVLAAQDDKRKTQVIEPEPEVAATTPHRTVIDLRRVVLRLTETGEEIQVNAPHQALIGRRDPGMMDQPEVDLSNYAGYRMGISRRHARIVRNDDGQLVIVDLGSSNGTFVNEVRLMPHVIHPLHDGDTLRLGKLILQVDAKMAYRRVALDPQPSRMKDVKAL